jgi:hypothetical protein
VATLLASLQRHPVLVLAGSLALQALNGVLFSHHVARNLGDASARGTPPGIAVGLAVLTALAAGPFSGAVSAAAGWAFFYALIVHKATTLIALPVWVVAAVAAGVVSDRLVELEHEYARMHLARTPLASVLGLLRSVRGEVLGESERKALAAAVDEAERALAAFDGADNA